MNLILFLLELLILVCAIGFFFTTDATFELDAFIIILIAILLHFAFNVFLVCPNDRCWFSCNR